MEFVQSVPKTDLARKTRQVLQAVQRGQTMIVESHGQPEAAILDILDYRIMRAVMAYHANPIDIDSVVGLSNDVVTASQDLQARFNLVLAHYLAQAISLGRAAELLKLPWVDLRLRFARLEVPVFTGPQDVAELSKDLDTLERWETEHASSSSS